MLAPKILHTIARHDMVRPGDRVLVGLSGGPDSVAMTHLLLEIRDRLEIELVLAHLDHGMREASADDARFCAAMAEELDLILVSRRVDVAAQARSNKRSLEEQARLCRYAFLNEQATALDCQRVAVGHTLDDQAETFLFRLLRGSGTRGLGAVHPVVDGIRIRPLLEVRRSEVLEYLRARSLRFRVDETNLSPAFTRNRLRLETLPRLGADFNPRLVETLASTASLLRDEDDFLAEIARSALEGLARRDGERLRLFVPSLLGLHPALRRRVVRLAFERARGSLTNLGRKHVEAALALAARGTSGREIHLPGLLCERVFDELWIHATPGDQGGNKRPKRKPGYNRFEYRLAPPARIRIPGGGGTIRAELVAPDGSRDGDISRDAAQGVAASGNAVVVGFAGRLPELKIRSPLPGDRFRPLGAPGTKSLTRYLMERKISRRDRDGVPLLVRPASVGERDEILWVAGHGISESSRLSDGRKPLRLEWVP